MNCFLLVLPFLQFMCHCKLIGKFYPFLAKNTIKNAPLLPAMRFLYYTRKVGNQRFPTTGSVFHAPTINNKFNYLFAIAACAAANLAIGTRNGEQET